MNIGIITQPLIGNYGGVLQAYALQQLIKKTKNNSKLIDFIPRGQSLIRYILSCVKTFLLSFSSQKKRPYNKRILNNRLSFFGDFVENNIRKTPVVREYSSTIIHNFKFDAIVVGSDQVWRPKVNCYLTDMFLKFADGYTIKRIAYAASFGVDEWEYTPKQAKVCSALAKKFDAISVREESGVKLCKEYLGVNATWVLDPTLLLPIEDYLQLCKDVPVRTDKYLAVYVLDESEKVTATYEKEAAERGLAVIKFHADSKSTLSVPEWLAMFRDASYVVTDSFHGTVFSIIFGKEFKCLYNKSRGSARFDSLLKLYESGKLNKMREFSMNWLKKALEN